MKRKGKTAAGAQRWICKSCKASTTHRYENVVKLLKLFLEWLLGRKRQRDMPGGGRTFRRLTARFWSIWPMPEPTGEVYRVVYVDGIYLARNLVVLIARSDEHVLAWYMARSESTASWSALLMRIAPPLMVVTDGGTGFASARRKLWPATKVQRCTFHAFCQIKRYTTSRPKLPAGVELYAIAKGLLYVKTLYQASVWLEDYTAWCSKWEDFLAEETVSEGRRFPTHENLVKAKRSLNTLVNQGTLFTFLDLTLTEDGALPSTNNKIEGGVMAQLRQLLRDHRGMSITRRIKAVFWWCYMHTECPMAPSEILKEMPTDETISDYYKLAASKQQSDISSKQWGDAVVWHELHKADDYRMDWD
jgi:hypothetical protein